MKKKEARTGVPGLRLTKGLSGRVSIARHKHGIDRIYYRGAKAVALIALIFKSVSLLDRVR